MHNITRHPADKTQSEQQAELYAANIGRFVAGIQKSPKSLNSVLNNSLDEFGYLTVDDPTMAWVDTWYAFSRATQAGSAIFLCAGGEKDEREVEFFIDDEKIRRMTTGVTIDANGWNWVRSMYLAMVCRNRPRIDMLAAYPIERLRASYVTHDEFVYAWIDVLQTYWRRGDNLIDKLIAAMRGTDATEFAHIGEEPVRMLWFPAMQLFWHLTQREEVKFNEALVEALELHKRYWTSAVDPEVENERIDDPNGYFSLPLLAMTCLARDSGFHIDVESDYLPQDLVLATRVGEAGPY